MFATFQAKHLGVFGVHFQKQRQVEFGGVGSCAKVENSFNLLVVGIETVGKVVAVDELDLFVLEVAFLVFARKVVRQYKVGISAFYQRGCQVAAYESCCSGYYYHRF